MSTTCRDEIQNPHKNWVRELLKALACLDNDYHCVNIALRSLHQCTILKWSGDRNQIEYMQNERLAIVDKAKQNFVEYHGEKCKFKKFHEKMINHLKIFAVQNNDPVIVRNCEKDINAMNKQFVKMVAYIKKCESDLEPFLKVLHDCTEPLLCKCCLNEYEWMPQGKKTDSIC